MTSQRHPLDFYETPAKLTRAMMRECPLIDDVCEPCVGHRAIADELAREQRSVVGWDIDPDKNPDRVSDATDDRTWNGHRFDWVVSNPPFNVAHEIVPHAVAASRVGCAMLLRITYLEPCEKRGSWLQENPISRLIIFNPRPRFRAGKGTDSATVAWFVWERDHVGDTKITYCTDWKTL